MSLTFQEKGNPTNRFTLTDEHVKKFRETLLGAYEREGGDLSEVNRKNEIFFRARVAVKILDDANYWGDEQLDEDEKYGRVVWLSRALRPLKRRYPNGCPAYIDVF